MYQKNRDLLEEIRERKKKLYATAMKKGLANEETIRHSQELDKLIYQYQRKIHKKAMRMEGKKHALQQVMFAVPALLAEGAEILT